MNIFRDYKPVAALMVLLAAGGLVLSLTARAAETDPLRVIVIDVRQGDATLVISPEGKTMLLDAGQMGSRYSPYDAGRDTIIPLMKSLGLDRVDVLVVTHPHADHIGGVPAIMEEFPVGVIYDSGYPHTISAYERMLELAREREIPVKVPIAGDLIPFGDKVTVQVLGPTLPLERRSFMGINNQSVVVRVEYGDFSFLNTGDAEHELEGMMVSSGSRLKSTVLNTGHHGSKTSTGPEFFAMVNPEVAVISAGKRNRFSHPDWEVMDRLRKAGTRVMRTDYHGHIIFTSDGETYEVESSPVIEDLTE